MSDFISQSLPWQQAQWQRIQQQVDAERLPHALLLAGPKDVGKRTFARALTAQLLCAAPQYGAACGACKSCQLLMAQAHPDAYWLAPEEAGKAVKIDQVRDLVERMAQTAQQGGRKVAVIAPAEAMNRNAANALLKTLEEPSGSALLMLISDAPGRLLPTIRSRCQRLEFPIPARAEIVEWLQPQATSADKLEQALLESEGRPMQARALLTGEDAVLRRELDDELAAVLSRQLSVLAAADRWKQRDWTALLYWLESRLVRAVRAQVVPQSAPSVAIAQLTAIPATALFGLLDQLRALINQTLAGTNPNQQLALESFLFNTCDALNKKSR
ncbi:MAG: DNA polymerase III subunit delta' [Spongiibacteraceae bacterium]